MNITDNMFLSMLSCHLNGKQCKEINFSNIDIERFKKLARIHKLGGIIYSCIKDTDVDKDIISYFELAFLTELSMFTARKKVVRFVEELLDKESIKYAFVKGGHIARLYPVEELRTMSDLDLLIKPEDRGRVKSVFMSNDATYVAEQSNEEVDVYRMKIVNIEVHTNLVEDDILINDHDYKEYFSDYIENVYEDSTGKNVLKSNELMIYMVYHMAKHFYNSGCGIRMLMDLFVVANKCSDIDWKYVYNELEKLELANFADSMFVIANKWFETNILPTRIKYVEELNIVEEFIVEGGVYGFVGANTSANKVDAMSRSGNKKSNYLIGMVKWAFPSYKQMRKYSPWFETKPAVLLPIAYIERFFRNAKERGGVWKWLLDIIKGKKDLDEKQMILSAVKLK